MKVALILVIGMFVARASAISFSVVRVPKEREGIPAWSELLNPIDRNGLKMM
jgi:hypothetical protein